MDAAARLSMASAGSKSSQAAQDPERATHRWTKASPFAGERYQMLVAAAVALDADEAVFEQAAAQVVVELPGDERR